MSGSKKSKKQNTLTVIALDFIFLVGLCLVLYPSLANYWNQRVQSRAIVDYEAALKNMTPADYSALFAEADEYNAKIRTIPYPFMNHEQVEGYWDILNVGGNGVIGYIDIEKIGVSLPIYHGTAKEVLNVAAGHLQGSSIPAGGESTHIAISAHRGLPSARLFTDLDRLEPGDTFKITVLDRVLTYEIDQVLIVLPQEIDPLNVIDGEDHCTLITCTPYGINTHRLLVRGTRVETITEKPAIYVANEAFIIDPMIVTPAVAAPMLFVLLIFLMIRYRRTDDDSPDDPIIAKALGKKIAETHPETAPDTPEPIEPPPADQPEDIPKEPGENEDES